MCCDTYWTCETRFPSFFFDRSVLALDARKHLPTQKTFGNSFGKPFKKKYAAPKNCGNPGSWAAVILNLTISKSYTEFTTIFDAAVKSLKPHSDLYSDHKYWSAWIHFFLRARAASQGTQYDRLSVSKLLSISGLGGLSDWHYSFYKEHFSESSWESVLTLSKQS